MSSLNGNQIKKLVTELKDVASAIMAGATVWELDPVDGWYKTTEVNLFRNRDQYHIGVISPEELN